MKTVFFILFLAMALLTAHNIAHQKWRVSELEVRLNVLSYLTFVTVVGNAIVVSTNSIRWAEIGMSMFCGSMSWILFMMLQFVMLYIDEPIPYRHLAPIAYIICAIDTISIWANNIFHHSFEISYVSYEGKMYFVIGQMKLPFYIHLTVCYIFALLSLFVLASKILRSTAFFKPKYNVVLGIFSVLLVVDAVSVFFFLPVNYAVLFYAFAVMTLQHYALSYEPKLLLQDTIIQAVENLEAGVICYDIHGKLIYCNRIVWEIFGYDEDLSLAEDFYARTVEAQNLKDLDMKEWDEKREYPNRTLYLHFLYRKMFDKDGGYIGNYCHVTDITENVLRHKEELNRVEAENQAKSNFVSRISHEIRTPINSVYGMNEMILRESKDPQILEYASDVKTSTEMVMNIINDVLDYSKINSGKMNLVEEPYDTKVLFNNLQRMMEGNANRKGLALVYKIDRDIPAKLNGDMVRLQQIMLNLISNAIKYTNKGTVTLDVHWVKQGDYAAISVSVTDTGIGIEKANIAKLFQAYERLDEVKNHSVQGTGLGLNITTKLLELMGSQLCIESEYGKGSRFYFDVRQKIVDETPYSLGIKTERKIERKQCRISFPGKKILMVDDGALNRRVFKFLLKNSGLDITEADGGIAALELFKNQKFDLIFLDHMMPDMDGVEVFENMKTMTGHPNANVPVIMLTANAVSGAKENYIKMGFNDFLAKPILPDELEQMIEKYLAPHEEA